MEEKNPETEADAQKSMEKPSALKELYVLLHDLVYILAFVTLFFVFALRLVSVDGYSMYPTLDDHDYVALLSNVLYQDVKAGDVIEIGFGTKNVKVEVLAVQDTSKKEEAKELFRYL